MRKSILITALFLAVLTQLAAEAWPISEVTVYRRGATVLRMQELTLTPGTNTVEIAGLPLGLSLTSCQLILDPSIKVRSIKTASDLRLRQDSGPHSLLRDSLEWISQEEGLLRSQMEVLKENRELSLDIDGDYAEELRALMDYHGEQNRKLHQDLRVLTAKKERLQAELQILQSTHPQPSSTGPVDSYVKLSLTLETSVAQTSSIGLSYFVSEAGWTTEYDLYMVDLSSDMTLDYKGKIWNRSSEDWRKVSLTLTTAQPTQSMDMPQLQEWWLAQRLETHHSDISIRGSRPEATIYYIDGIRVSADKANILPSRALQMPSINYDASAPVSYDEQLTATVFTVDGQHTIPRLTNDYTLILTEQQVEAEYVHRATPKLSTYAYLYAQVSNLGDLLISQGQLTVFANGRMQGQAFLDPRVDPDGLELPLGVDFGIAIERKKITHHASRKRLKQAVQKTFDYQITVRNNKTVPITLELLDQLPLSTSEEIKIMDVVLGDGVREGAEVTWTLELGSDETASRTLSYVVQHPHKMNVGL